ncbi:MAG: hypothetical protein MI757_22835 [Pirellulales bacterium]|nr:hypothetical protein [Pirellulales bacterium]
MRTRTRARLTWFVVGLAAGWLGSSLYTALQLWPFEDKAFFVWLRWAGKEGIKWSFIALVFAVVLFVIVQLLNYFYFAREVQKEEHRTN